MSRTLHGRRSRGDRGAVAVEAALITPLLIALIFGMIDFSLLLKDYVAATSATRAGSRTASAEPHQTSFLTDTAAQMTRATSNLRRTTADTKLWVYRVAPGASGNPPTSCPSSTTNAQCVLFTWSGTAFVATSSSLASWPATAVNACPMSPSNPNGPDAVGVRLITVHNFLTPLSKGTFTIDDKSVLNFEPVPLGISGAGCAAS